MRKSATLCIGLSLIGCNLLEPEEKHYLEGTWSNSSEIKNGDGSSTGLESLEIQLSINQNNITGVYYFFDLGLHPVFRDQNGSLVGKINQEITLNFEPGLDSLKTELIATYSKENDELSSILKVDFGTLGSWKTQSFTMKKREKSLIN